MVVVVVAVSFTVGMGGVVVVMPACLVCCRWETLHRTASEVRRTKRMAGVMYQHGRRLQCTKLQYSYRALSPSRVPHCCSLEESSRIFYCCRYGVESQSSELADYNPL